MLKNIRGENSVRDYPRKKKKRTLQGWEYVERKEMCKISVKS